MPHTHDDALGAVTLFRSLSRRQLRALAASGREVSGAEGKELATEGLGALALHVLLEGTVEVTVGGRVVRTLGPGDYFGEISMIDGRPRSATVTATSPVRTLAIPHAGFASLVEKDGELAMALLVALCARVREAEARD